MITSTYVQFGHSLKRAEFWKEERRKKKEKDEKKKKENEEV